MTVVGPSFRVLARGVAPSAADLAAAVALGASAHYVAVVADGADLELLHESGVDVRIWAPDWLVQANAAYDVPHRLPGFVAVGDAYGDFLVEGPAGLGAVGPGALDPDEVRPVARDLDDLLGGSLGDLAT